MSSILGKASLSVVRLCSTTTPETSGEAKSRQDQSEGGVLGKSKHVDGHHGPDNKNKRIERSRRKRHKAVSGTAVK